MGEEVIQIQVNYICTGFDKEKKEILADPTTMEVPIGENYNIDIKDFGPGYTYYKPLNGPELSGIAEHTFDIDLAYKENPIALNFKNILSTNNKKEYSIDKSDNESLTYKSKFKKEIKIRIGSEYDISNDIFIDGYEFKNIVGSSAPVKGTAPDSGSLNFELMYEEKEKVKIIVKHIDENNTVISETNDEYGKLGFYTLSALPNGNGEIYEYIRESETGGASNVFNLRVQDYINKNKSQPKEYYYHRGELIFDIEFVEENKNVVSGSKYSVKAGDSYDIELDIPEGYRMIEDNSSNAYVLSILSGEDARINKYGVYVVIEKNKPEQTNEFTCSHCGTKLKGNTFIVHTSEYGQRYVYCPKDGNVVMEGTK